MADERQTREFGGLVLDRPRIVLPSETGKFVQLYIDVNGVREPVLRCSSERTFHPEILRLALEEFGLDFKTERSITGASIPVRQGQGYQATGMGSLNFVSKERILVSDNPSEVYGIGPNKQHFEELMPCFKERGLGLKIYGDENARR